MREIKEKSRQTVWLLTMLTVMIVLSAYYLLSEPLVSTDIWSEDIENINNQALSQEDVVIEDISMEEAESLDSIYESSETGDFILGIKMERDNNRSKQIDTYFTMMKTNLSEEAISEINNKIEQLQILEESEYVLEKLIMADGYNDVVVFSNDESVDVIIESKSLTNEAAVKIIKLVSERLDIPAVNVHIKTIN